MSAPAPAQTRRCRFHCTACDRHFVSLRGFDAHRTGPARDRSCLDPASDDRFRLITAEGECRLGAATERGVQIWGMADVDTSRLAALKDRARPSA